MSEENKLFKIQGVGLDTTALDFSPDSDGNSFDYIFTSILANNELMIKDYVNYNTASPLITYINYLDRADDAINKHLDLLERDIVDLLLVDASCDFVKYSDTLSLLVDNKAVDVIGVYGPKSVERLKEIKEVLPTLKYIGLEICPLEFDHDIVSWAQENGVEILGFNPFGGYAVSSLVIDSFTVPYLLGFAANYSTLVFLSSRDTYLSSIDRDYLTSLIGKESSSIYELDKTIHKLPKKLKKVAHISLKADLNHIIPINLPDSIYSSDDIVVKLGSPEEDLRDFDTFVGSIEDRVYRYYEEFSLPEDTQNDLAILSLFKPYVLDIIRTEYSELEGWKLSMLKAGEKIFIVSASRAIYRGRGIFKRLVSSSVVPFLLYINNKSLEFCRLFNSTGEITPEIEENAVEEESES